MSAFLQTALAAMLLTTPGMAPPQPVVAALHAAAPALADRVAIISYHATISRGCTVEGAEVVGGLARSGPVTVRLLGTTKVGLACQGWATAEVRVFGLLWVTHRMVGAGMPLTGSITQVEHEIPRGADPLESLTGDEVAAETLAAGRFLEDGLVRRPGPVVGGHVSVVLRSGGLRIETAGSLIRCSGGRSCARLRSGKEVEGILSGDQLLVETP